MTTTNTRNKVHHRTMSDEYGLYNFVDKDPVIDHLRTAIQREASALGVSFDRVLHMIAGQTHISYGCFNGWFYGPTKSPRFCMVQRVAMSLGLEFDTKPVRRKLRLVA